MEQVIVDLIESDINARKEVAQAQLLRTDLKQRIAEEKKTISDKSWNDAKTSVGRKKVALDETIRKAEQENKAEFEQALNALQSSFYRSSKSWCEEIVKRCLEV